MTDDTLRRILKIDDATLRQLQDLAEQIVQWQADPAIKRMLSEYTQTQDVLRAALGPLEDMRRQVLAVDVGHLGRELHALGSLCVDIEQQFRLPETSEIPRLLQQLELDRTARSLAHYEAHAAAFQRTLESIATPWLDIRDQDQSLAGFMELHEIGHVLRSMSVFGSEASEWLRQYLGDWREQVDWPYELLSDPFARSAFYAERGLNRSLTNFPAAAFHEFTTVAGVKRPTPPLISGYDDRSKRTHDDEAGFERNNAAHDRLQRFETHLRRFIDQKMTTSVGEHWVKHRVPGEIQQEWKDKRSTALEDGEPEQRLIAYADFTDYVRIIARNDNWEQVFRPFFRRKSLVQESLQRLYPIRICAMHARIITQDDELFLMAETVRLLKAMGIKT